VPFTREWLSRAHQHTQAIQSHSHVSGWVEHISTLRLYSAIHVGTRWKIQDRRQIKNTENRQTKQPRTSNQRKMPQNKTTLVQSPFTTLGQEMRWAYSTTLPSPHGAVLCTHTHTLHDASDNEQNLINLWIDLFTITRHRPPLVGIDADTEKHFLELEFYQHDATRQRLLQVPTVVNNTCMI